MSTTALITTCSELEGWLRDNTWFEDSIVVELEQGADSIRIVLAEHVRGTFVAGSERTMRDFVLTATGVRRTTFEPGLLVAGHWCEGLEVSPDEAPVAFRVDVPGMLEVVCERLSIEVRADRVETVPAWVSEVELAAVIPHTPVPAPEKWLARFRAAGLAVVWRMYGGESQQPPDAADYEGWFLQVPEELPTTTGGLFFFACKTRNGDLSLQWSVSEAGEQAGDRLFDAAKRVVASFERAAIQCGNCQFSASQWRAFLESGALPFSKG